MADVVDLNARRTRLDTAACLSHREDARRHIANTADAMCSLLRACGDDVAAGALDAARMQLAGAALAMLGPGWELRRTGEG